MKKKSNQKNLIIILIPILVLTVFWVASNVYYNLKTSTIEVPIAANIIPIKGTFDTDTIEQLKSRKRVEIVDDIILPAAQVDLPIQVSTQSSEIESVEIEEENAATQSAEIDL